MPELYRYKCVYMQENRRYCLEKNIVFNASWCYLGYYMLQGPTRTLTIVSCTCPDYQKN